MSESLRRSAVDVTSHILETMFFVTIEPWTGRAEEKPFSDSARWLEGRIGFRGPFSGEVRVYVPLPLARDMATNFLGLEEGTPSDAQATDVISEVTNMICGNLLSQLDRKVIYDLSIPEAGSVSPEVVGREGDASAMTLDFNAEGQRVRLVVQFLPYERPGA
jgi:CheY-specific phosphatase CheX